MMGSDCQIWLPCAIGGAMNGSPGMMYFLILHEELKNLEYPESLEPQVAEQWKGHGPWQFDLTRHR